MQYKKVIKSWKARIKATGLTQREFAKKVGVTQDTITKLLGERHEPSIGTYFKIEVCLAKCENISSQQEQTRKYLKNRQKK